MAKLMPTGKQQYFDTNGNPLSGGRIYTFEPGPGAPKLTYSNAAGTVENENPVILDARGEALIFWDGVYDVQVKDANDNLIYTVQNYSASNEAAGVSYSGASLDAILKSGVNKVVSSISSLRAVDKAKYTQACVTGYYAAGDGGGGIYYYDAADTSSADNGGTIIVASDGGRWKLAQSYPVNVKQFGAKIDGVTDDITRIKAALAVCQHVYFPPGQCKITAPIDWTNQLIEGAVDNGALSTAANQTMILCDGSFPAFRYYHPNGYTSQGGGVRNFNIYFADGTLPASAAARGNAIGIYINDNNNTTGYPAFAKIENITVRGGMYPVYDKSGSWMMTFDGIHAENCFAGFYKQGGTTIRFNNCYSRGAYSSWYIANVLGVVIDASAFDLSSCSQTGNGYYPCYISNSTVVISGMDIEAPNLSGAFNSIIWADNAAVVSINSARMLNPQVTGASENYLVKATNSAKVKINGIDFSTPAYSGTPGTFAFLAATGSAAIVVENAKMPAVTGTAPSSPYAALATSGSVDYNNCTTTYTWQGNSRRIDKSIRFSAVLDTPSIAAQSFYTATYSVVGAVVGDFAQASMDTAINGIILNAWVNQADQVAVNIYNTTTGAIDLPSATLRLRVVQQ